ncbi:histone-lysine N-methyltransferase SETMAR isoform X1 [Bombus impatiens]|uniref:Histone-lysine N-methyltransferase SETMAR isoform X1 n=1 Tax=Bombus impatiens TaxID=132113 RepID=A0A6P6F976_BOMIM|nr:histone-lysine N-methyltransferase SETMAR isoform X1 [Bombus impatiens]XP_033175945.1 histone-lysine N-methyltransferase SETMAR isoform X1 [Bombus impatiens]
MEDQKMRFRYIMYQCFKKCSTPKNTAKEICDVYGDRSITVQTVRTWFRRFRTGNFNLKDEDRSGRPSTTDIDLIKAYLDENPKSSLREIEDALNIPRTTIHEYVTKLGYVNRYDVWLPHHLTESNRMNRILICDLLIQRNKTEPFLEKLITGDESWILYDSIARKRSWSSRDKCPPTVARPGLHPKKVLLSIWWDWKGILYYELLPEGQTINSEKYCTQLEKLKEAIITKRPEMMNKRGFVFHYDNTRPHISLAVQMKLLEFDWDVLPHPPYSPDLVPSHYYLFLPLKDFLRDRKSKSVNEVKNGLEEYFKSKPREFWKNGIMRLPERWQKVVEQKGSYII